MNPDTRVAVCGYEGDAHQVEAALGQYTHHECPLTILSPDDAKIEIPGVDCRFGGKRQYIGQLSLDRQREHLRILLEYPEEFFLVNDSDSMCLSPKIPQYLYDEPDFLWSNLIVDNMGRPNAYPEGFPNLAFQPPYFLSRTTIKALLAVVEGDNIAANPVLPFIDHYMVQLAVKANYPWRNFTDGISCPISSDRNSARLTWDSVRRHGAVMIHSVKAPKFWQPLADAHAKWLEQPRASDVNPFPAPGDLPTPTQERFEQHQMQQRQHLLAATRRQAMARQSGRPQTGLKA